MLSTSVIYLYRHLHYNQKNRLSSNAPFYVILKKKFTEIPQKNNFRKEKPCILQYNISSRTLLNWRSASDCYESCWFSFRRKITCELQISRCYYLLCNGQNRSITIPHWDLAGIQYQAYHIIFNYITVLWVCHIFGESFS